jgi:tRNA(fMet)-specific endonuclease VapC
MFLFDTDHLGLLQRQRGREFETLRDRLQRHDESQFFVAIVSFHEQIQGWNAYIARARNEESVAQVYLKLEGILMDFARAQVLPYSPVAADVFTELRRQRIRIGTMDLRIGAIAIASGMTVLTRNTVDFEKIPSLSVEDWTAEAP